MIVQIEPDEHLTDLHQCKRNRDAFRNAVSACSQRVIGIHESMDGNVDGTKVKAYGRSLTSGVPDVPKRKTRTANDNSESFFQGRSQRQNVFSRKWQGRR